MGPPRKADVVEEEYRRIASGGRATSPREILLEITYDRLFRYRKQRQLVDRFEKEDPILNPELESARGELNRLGDFALAAAREAAPYYHAKFAAIHFAVEDDRQRFVIRVPEMAENSQEWLRSAKGEQILEIDVQEVTPPPAREEAEAPSQGQPRPASQRHDPEQWLKDCMAPEHMPSNGLPEWGK